mgnify:CR=1 FL=1
MALIIAFAPFTGGVITVDSIAVVSDSDQPLARLRYDQPSMVTQQEEEEEEEEEGAGKREAEVSVCRLSPNLDL